MQSSGVSRAAQLEAEIETLREDFENQVSALREQVRELQQNLANARHAARQSARLKMQRDRDLQNLRQKYRELIELHDEQQELQSTSVVRTVHHLSATGGTLIAKCIAAMPNVLLLNEVDPFSPLPYNHSGKPRFTPRDIISLANQGDPDIPGELIKGLFLRSIDYLRGELAGVGRSLVLRDHTHSHYLVGQGIPEREPLRAMLGARFSVRSVVTVRDPVDSYLSLRTRGWDTHFSPSTFQEYCSRYLAFLDDYEGTAIFRYEDFVEDPAGTMRGICEVLGLPYYDRFEEVFDMYHFSGDSGRGGDTIEPRPQRKIDDELRKEAVAAGSYHELVARIGYVPIAT